MIDMLLWLVGVPSWAVGGAYASRAALAHAERHYLALSPEQEVMDTDDWIGASIYAAAAFALFPVVAVGWGVGKLLSPFKKPAATFLTPPVQKQFNQHVDLLRGQKELVMMTAKTYQEVLAWEPKDHPDRVALVQQLQTQIREQMEDLMRMTSPTRAFDGNFLASAKEDVKALTAGETWKQ